MVCHVEIAAKYSSMCVTLQKTLITLVFTVNYIRVRVLTDMFRPDQPKPAPVGLRSAVSSPPGTDDVVFQHHAQQTIISAPGQQGLPAREFNER